MESTTRQTYILLVVGGILIIILFLIAVISIFFRQVYKQSTVPTPSPTIAAYTKPPVQYDRQAFNKSIQQLENRQTLSSQDTAAKNKIIAMRAAGSEIVFENSEFRIHYSSGLDMFDVEILTTNLSKDKTDAVNWFLSEGMSKQGVCSVPVQFYLNSDVSTQLQNSNTVFSPLPDGC